MKRLTRAASAALISSALTAAVGAAPAAATGGHTFSQLVALEDRAEAIAGGKRTGAAARAAAAQIVAGWPGVRAAFASQSAAKWSLTVVDGQIAALRSADDTAQLQRSANETTSALAPLFELAGDRVPVAVHLLDYLHRSIALDVHGAEWSRADAEGATLERTWLGLRPQVTDKRGGAAAIQAANRAVDALKAAIASRDTARASAATKQAATAVDALEKVFSA